MRLVLFDVDGTILIARGAGRRALTVALKDIYGTAGDIDGYNLGGQTDPRIVHDVMEGAGLAREAVRERLDECFEAYARGLAAEIGDGRGVVTLPGIAELVRRLHDHEEQFGHRDVPLPGPEQRPHGNCHQHAFRPALK